MAIIFGNATVPASTTGTFLFQVPPGVNAVTFYNPGVNAIYVGSNTATSLGGSPASGFLIPWTAQTAFPVTVPGFTGSAATKIYGATAGTASTYATTLQYIISTNA